MIYNKQTQKEAHIYIDLLLEKDEKVNIEKVRKIRSNPQNRYLHGILFGTFAVELGWNIDEAKQYFKKLFLTYEKDGQKFQKETSKLNTKELEEFAENCRVHASMSHGIYIKKPNEVDESDYLEMAKYAKYINAK
jgi:hypothetical protein